MPKDIFPVWLSKEETEQIISVWEKQGVLGSIIPKIRAAYATKGIR